MPMSDRQVRQMVDLLGAYVTVSLAEGIPLEEIGDGTTVRMVLSDCVGTLPAYETVDLPDSVRALTDV